MPLGVELAGKFFDLSLIQPAANTIEVYLHC